MKAFKATWAREEYQETGENGPGHYFKQTDITVLSFQGDFVLCVIHDGTNKIMKLHFSRIENCEV